MLKDFKYKNTAILALSALAIMAMPLQSHAQTSAPVDIVPASKFEDKALLNSGNTHSAIKLSPDKSELIRLKQKAGSIIVGNPEHVSVLAENAKTLVLVPGLPGATHITILDGDANIIMSRHVIVASPKERYVRVRKPCKEDDENCQPTRVYYCPDACHEVRVAQEIKETNDSPFDALEQIVQQGNTQNTPPAQPVDTDTE